MTTRASLDRLRLLAGLLLVGQGALVVAGILDHELPLPMGAALVVAGLGLLAWGRAPRVAAPGRASVVAALGATLVLVVALYNLARGSTLAPPEVALLLYGAALVAASRALGRHVGRVDVATLVAFSFPLLLAPLALWATNAALAAGMGGTPVGWYVRHTLVAPMAALLALAGADVRMLGDTVALATPRGTLFLTVGVVCAGLYAAAVFLGVFALFAWERRTPPARLAAYLALGLLGLHVANVARLVALALVGARWGGDALQFFHRHLGWALFLAWTLLFWWLVLRRFEGRTPAASGAP